MANPITIAATLPTADDDGIAKSQSPGAAGYLTLDGDLVSNGVAVLTSAGCARQVLLTFGSSEVGKTFTVVGTNATGNRISESIAGAASTATSVQYYRTVTSVYISAASAGTIIVGTNGVGSTRVVNIDTALNPSTTTLVVTVSGTVNYTVQWTVNDIQGTITWNNDPVLATQTSGGSTSYAMPVSGLRILINSGTGTVSGTMLQSGLGS